MGGVREGLATSVRSNYLRSDRSMLAGTALADLSWSLGRLLDAIPEWETPVLTLITSLLPFSSIDQGLTWLLFTVSFYVFTPTVYSDRLGFKTDTRLFRGVVVAYSLGFSFGLVTGTPLMRISLLLGLWILGAATILVYLREVEGWALLDEPAVLLQPFEAFRFGEQLQSDYTEYLTSPTKLDWFSIGTTLLAVGGLVILPCFILGLIARLLLFAGPLPDVLVLGWTLWAAFASRVSVVPAVGDGRWFDLEARLHHGVQTATKNMKGLFLSLWVVLGVFLAAGTGGLFFTALPIAIDTLPAITDMRVLRRAPLLVSKIIGLPSVLLASSLFGLWVWLRTFQRVGEFADYWGSMDETERGEVGGDLQPRPVGMALPAAVGLFLETVAFHGPLWAFAMSWPLYVVGLVGCVWLTRRRSEADQFVAHEDLVILGSLLVHLLGLFLLTIGEQLLSVSSLEEVGLLLGTSIFVPIAILITALTYFPDASQYADKHAGVQSYVAGGYLAVAGSLALVLSANGSGGAWVLVRVFGLAAIGFGILGEFVDVLHDRE